jgi:hypothetical protein
MSPPHGEAILIRDILNRGTKDAKNCVKAQSFQIKLIKIVDRYQELTLGQDCSL